MCTSFNLQQWRLFPYMAATCALKVFVADFIDQYLECVERSNSGKSIYDLVRLHLFPLFLTMDKISTILC